jgi:glycosyltransferase involved in cell wall biosynthesis
MRRAYRRLPLLRDVLAGRRPKLSVVMPVYNEVETVVEVIDSVLDFESGTVDLELIVVESNSADGSRERVLKYEGDPRVRIVLQDHARGKGNAVRDGLRYVTGDIVLIQDADLEYRVEDYPRLVDPIVRGEADFILGSRHVPGRPMRLLPGARLASSLMNAGHWVFAGLFDVVYQARLRDPFTMFKVFRTDAVQGIRLVANRFDFDWELVAKLLRAGFQPLEIPIDYRARGFTTGKKVRPFRDPPGWVLACFRFRFSPLHDVGSGRAGAPASHNPSPRPDEQDARA